MAKRKARPGAVSPEEKGGAKRMSRRKGKARHNARCKSRGKARCKARCKARRNHKDSLFCRLFSDKENALSLYNALTGSSYTDADGLEIVTLEDAVYLSQKNDCAVCVQSSLALFEQQSSWNPNMPLRGLLYFAAEYAGWLARHKVDVHSSSLVKIPSPVYFVLYNGMDRQVEKTELRLSESFEKPAEGYEWTAHVVNVNAGHNAQVLGRCPLLGEYAAFIADIRQGQADGKPLTEAVDAAVDKCIRKGGKLAEFMRKHKAEVNSMYLFGVDFEAIHREAMQREAQEKLKEAWADGMSQGQERALRSLMDSMSWTATQAMDALKIPAEEREKYAAKLEEAVAEA
ncbi:MAG: hypothetical protein K6G18_12405 [Treponema sp.]|nr:hypothetical protein [Treponema sp.]